MTIAHPPDKKRRLAKRERKLRQTSEAERHSSRAEYEHKSAIWRAEKEESSPVIYLPGSENQWDNTNNDDSDARTTRSDSDAPHPPTADGTATDDNTMGDTPNKKNLTAQEQERLASLKSMLDASHARYRQASRNRRPVFAAGLEVKVLKGDFEGEIGIVLDADYIENRALISLAGQESPRWLGFRSLGHAD